MGNRRRTRERQVDNGPLLYQFKARSPVSTEEEKLTGDDEEVFTGAVQMNSEMSAVLSESIQEQCKV
jgi:hypothetical protein